MKKIITSILFLLSILSVFSQDLYRARTDGNVDSVYAGINLPDAYKGDSVIIGVTDWGFDYTHPNFYDTSMTRYRILRAWDQFRTAGPAPDGFSYGTELIGRDQLLAAQCDTSNIYGHHYHGTHVAGIAAGSGAGTAYRGVAPNAELIFCSFIPNEQSVIDAFEWMYDVAQQEHKRLVINMSWGLYWMDNFEGTGPVGQKMQELSDLGVVFVTSGGNNGDEKFHLSHPFEGDTIHTRMMFPAENGSDDYWGASISMTNSAGKPFATSFNIRNTQYEILAATPFYQTSDGNRYEESFLAIGTDTVFYNVEIISSDESGRPKVRLRVKKKNNTAWRMCLSFTAQEGTFHAWNVAELTTGVGNWGGTFKKITLPNWVNGDCQYGTGAPANVQCAITVAAHKSGTSTDSTWTPGDICYFSSYGPTIDGRDKPDISAPGYEVCSSVSSYADESISATQSIVYEGRTYKFAKLSGTSMSSPFTTGVVALMLQANPTATPQDIKQALIYSATKDSLTEARGMVRFGHGKVNALQAILNILYHVGTQEFECSSKLYTIFPNPTNDELFISTPNNDGNTTFTVYDISGKLLQKGNVCQGVTRISLQDYPSGCYIVRIVNGKYIQTEKIIKSK